MNNPRYKLDITGQAYTEIDGVPLEGLPDNEVWELVDELERNMDNAGDWVVLKGGYHFGRDAIMKALKENGYV